MNYTVQILREATGTALAAPAVITQDVNAANTSVDLYHRQPLLRLDPGKEIMLFRSLAAVVA